MSARPVVRSVSALAGDEAGRVVALYGASGVGVSTLARICSEESRARTCVVDGSGGRVGVGTLVDAAIAEGCEVVFLDGVPNSVGDVQWLYDTRWVTPVGGLVVRVERASLWEPLRAAELAQVERAMQDFILPWTVIHADDLESACLRLLSVAGIVR